MGKAIFWLVVVFGVLLALRLYNTAKARARASALACCGSACSAAATSSGMAAASTSSAE